MRKSSVQHWSFCIFMIGSSAENCTACLHGESGRGPVVDRGKEGSAAGGQGDAECAVVGGVEAGFAHPAAQQILDRRGLGCGARVGVLEASRRLGVARGTVQARLDRLQARGVVTGYGPDIDPAALDHAVTAFVTLEIRQAGGHDPVAERLAAIPEVLEVHTITGAGDMLCRVVARTNADLQRVIDAIVGAAGVVRASTVIALATPVPYRVLPLVRTVTRPAPARS